MGTRNGKRGAGPRVIVLIVAALALLGPAILLGAHGYANSRMNHARDAWNESLGSWEDILARNPARGANASAVRLEGIAASLGINIAPRIPEVRDDPGRARPTGAAGERFGLVKSEVFKAYLYEQIEEERRGKIARPPETLATFMQEHEAELLELRRHLLDAEVPVWESELSLAAAAPIPNLLGQVDLTKLLTSVALARTAGGDSEGAALDVQAAWHLTRSIRESPILINQLVAIACTRMQVGALRKLPEVPETWAARLQEHDFRASFLTSMKYEGRVWLEYDVKETLSASGAGWVRRLASPALRPYNRLCLADVSGAWMERMRNLERVNTLCDHDLSVHNANLDIPVPRWNLIGKLIVPNLANAVDRLARLELDLELTGLMLEPWAESGPRPSETCPGDHWVYSRSDDGLEIAFDREISWPNQSGFVLPTRARLE